MEAGTHENPREPAGTVPSGFLCAYFRTAGNPRGLSLRASFQYRYYTKRCYNVLSILSFKNKGEKNEQTKIVKKIGDTTTRDLVDFNRTFASSEYPNSCHRFNYGNYRYGCRGSYIA